MSVGAFQKTNLPSLMPSSSFFPPTMFVSRVSLGFSFLMFQSTSVLSSGLWSQQHVDRPARSLPLTPFAINTRRGNTRLSGRISCCVVGGQRFESHTASRTPYLKTHVVLLSTQSRAAYQINRLTPNDPYMGRTAPLTSNRCIIYIYIYIQKI